MNERGKEGREGGGRNLSADPVMKRTRRRLLKVKNEDIVAEKKEKHKPKIRKKQQHKDRCVGSEEGFCQCEHTVSGW